MDTSWLLHNHLKSPSTSPPDGSRPVSPHADDREREGEREPNGSRAGHAAPSNRISSSHAAVVQAAASAVQVAWAALAASAAAPMASVATQVSKAALAAAQAAQEAAQAAPAAAQAGQGASGAAQARLVAPSAPRSASSKSAGVEVVPRYRAATCRITTSTSG